MKKANLLIVAFIILALPAASFSVPGLVEPTDSLKDDIHSAGSSQIPTWMVGTTWTYRQDFRPDNMELDERLTYTVDSIEFIDIDGVTTPVYRVELDGDLLGGSASGEQDLVFTSGYYEGYAYYRMDDLAQVLDYQYRYLRGNVVFPPFNPQIQIATDSTATNDPSLDNYHFPLEPGGHFWANNTIKREGYIETRTPQGTNHEVIDEIDDFDRYVHVSEDLIAVGTDAGTFDTYLVTHHESGDDTGTVEFYYNGNVQNNVKEVVERSDRADRTRVLESYNVIPNSNTLSVTPSEAHIGESVTISGNFPGHGSSQFTVRLPSVDFSTNVQTDPSGAFSLQMTVPEVESDTPSPGILGKVGVVAHSTSSPSSAYRTTTLTVLEPPEGVPPSVTLHRPNGGEVFTAGTQEEVQWSTSQGDSPINNVGLAFSGDAGNTWTVIASGLPDTGSYMWTVSPQASDQCLIRIVVSDVFGRTGNDVSDGYFVIEGIPPEPPSDLMVEHYGMGFGILFEDDVEGGDKGYTKGTSNTGSEWGIRSNGASVGTHSWDFGDGEYYKMSSYGYLSWLITPEISIPPEAEYVELSFDHWRSFGALQTLLDGGNVKISTTGAQGTFSLITPTQGYDGAINNNFGNPLGGQQAWSREVGWQTVTFDLTAYTGQSIHIRWDAGIEAYDEDMKEGWRIDNIMVTAEGIISDGNEHNLLTWGPSTEDPGHISHYNVYRSETQIGGYDLIASVNADGSPEYSYIDWNKGADDDILWWYIVRSVDVNGVEEQNTNAVPEPGDIPTISLSRPDGGEVFEAGTYENIEWTTEMGGAPIDHVNLGYSINGGLTWTTIASEIPDSGVYSWLVPDEDSTECMVRAAVVDTQGLSGVDISTHYFTIESLPPMPPSSLDVDLHGADELVDNGMFTDDHEPWILTRPVDEGESGWSEEAYLIGGSIYASAEAQGAGDVNTENSHWEQDIGPTSDTITFSGAFRKDVLTQGVGPRASKVNHATLEILIHDSDSGWVSLFLEDDTSDGDTDWVEIDNVVYHPSGYVDGVRVSMHIEAEGNSGVGIDRRAKGIIWVDHVSLEVMGEDGKEHVKITWDRSPDDPSKVVSYNLYRAESHDGPWDSPIASISAHGSPSYEYIDEGKGTGDDVRWWYKIHARDSGGRECQGTPSKQEPGEVSFDLSVEDIVAGERPVFMISNAEDPQGEPFNGPHQVYISVDGSSASEELTFSAGSAQYTWEIITGSGECQASVTLEGTTVYCGFHVQVGQADTLVITPGNAVIRAGQAQTYTAVAYDEHGNEVGDVTADTVWSIDAHAEGEWVANTYTSRCAGTWDVVGEKGGITQTVQLTVEAGDTHRVSIYPSGEITVATGEEVTFVAEAYDSHDNLITDTLADFTWAGTDTSGIFREDVPGTYSVTAAYQSVTSSPTTVIVEDEHTDEPDYHMEIINHDERVLVGEPVAVEYRVKNVGEVVGEQDIIFMVNGVTEDTHLSLILDPGQEQIGTFIWNAPEVGIYTLRVSSDDDSDSATVTVDPVPVGVPYFRITLAPMDTSVSVGESITVGFTVKNIGDTQGTQNISFKVNGITKEVLSGLTLASGEEYDGAFTWSEDVEGTYLLGIASEDSIRTETVTVDPLTISQPFFDVTISTYDAEVTVGDTVIVSFVVKNIGEAEGSRNIVFTVDGVQKGSVTRSLEPGQEHTGDFNWDTDDVGTYTLKVSTGDTDYSVEVSVKSVPIGVPYFRITIESPSSPVDVTLGNELIVVYKVENIGDVAGTQDITITLNGVIVGENRGVSLEGNMYTTDEFAWEAHEVGTHNIHISSEDARRVLQVIVAEEVDDGNGGDEVPSDGDTSLGHRLVETLTNPYVAIFVLILISVLLLVLIRRGGKGAGSGEDEEDTLTDFEDWEDMDIDDMETEEPVP